MNSMNRVCITFFLVLLSGSPFVSATSRGNIAFSGTIVNEACAYYQTGNWLNVQCLPGNKPVPVNTAARQRKGNFGPGKVTTIQWVDARHLKGIVSVNYF